jgi:hypothetical protein
MYIKRLGVSAYFARPPSLRTGRGPYECVRPTQNAEKRLKQNSFGSHLSI